MNADLLLSPSLTTHQPYDPDQTTEPSTSSAAFLPPSQGIKSQTHSVRTQEAERQSLSPGSSWHVRPLGWSEPSPSPGPGSLALASAGLTTANFPAFITFLVTMT